MKAFLFCVALWIIPAPAQQQKPASTEEEAKVVPPSNPASLAAQLRRLQADLDSGRDSGVLAALPSAWRITTPERPYSISTAPLRQLLMSARNSSERNASIQQAKGWLDEIAQHLERSSTSPAEARYGRRAQLDRILARPEFAAVRSPGRWELFQQRVAAWIRKLFRRLFAFAAQHPTGGKILFWVIVAGAVGVLAVWLAHIWTRENTILALPRLPRPSQARTWEAWVQAARQAAGSGDSREAIHCAYWAGIARLQEARVLPEGLTHTPREYLRLMSALPPESWPQSRAMLPRSTLLEALGALTSGLERFWYAGRAAGLDDFRASLSHLESLGCNVE